jgi:hypothetical protein
MTYVTENELDVSAAVMANNDSYMILVAHVLMAPLNVGSRSNFMYTISSCYLCYIPAQRPVPAGTLGVKIKN